ncbi:CD59 glycoprotein isoform X1 [Ochotona princeps]|uniref:CD59 glycoprotein isoform X1 n=2 Tax=Ochotona princeps TaxID=9978 RepID=UPI0027156004|nr:CD59 glycoprotein isoform X1 [Ochotona princeps]
MNRINIRAVWLQDSAVALGQGLWIFTMTSRAPLVLFRFLFLLAVFYSSDCTLKCYHCEFPLPNCTTVINCAPNLDSCLTSTSGPRVYRRCWRLQDCNFEFISERLQENSLKYECCQKNLCNGDNKNDGTTLSGLTMLLVAPVLTATGHLYV